MASAKNSVALGTGASATGFNDIAFGSGSVSEAAHTGITALFGGTAQGVAKTDSGVVSVGTAGNERQLQNLAPGVISGTSTNAVNGSQLQSVATGVNALGDSTASSLGSGAIYDSATGAISGFSAPISSVDASGKVGTATAKTTVGGALGALNTNISNLAGSVVQYEKKFNGTPDRTNVTLGGRDANGVPAAAVRLGNVADGRVETGSKDAVNGGQLDAVRATADMGWNLSINSDTEPQHIAPGGKVGFVNGLNTSVARYGSKIQVSVSSDPAFNSVTTSRFSKDDMSTRSAKLDGDGLTTIGADGKAGPSVGSIGIDAGGKTIANVADGSVATGSKQAVNGGQLDATHTAMSNYLGGGANLNEGKGPSYAIQGNTYDNVGGALISVNNNLTTVNNAINGGGMKYFRANSTLPDATASGTDAVAVGPQAVASGASSVAMGSGAQARSASGTAIGFKAVVQQTGGVALGAGSVASTAAGVAGYVPEGAGGQQASAVRATTGTQGAVSVGNASNGEFRQVTGVAAGTADSDATNVAQLKALASTAMAGGAQYETRPDGSTNYSQLTLGNGQAPNGTRISNVAPGVQGTDAVNVNQLVGATATSVAYTDARVNQVGQALQGVARKSYSGTAAAMALESAPYVAGKLTYAAGMGLYSGESAVGVSLRKTADNGRWSVSGGVSAASAGTVGMRVAVSGVWD